MPRPTDPPTVVPLFPGRVSDVFPTTPPPRVDADDPYGFAGEAYRRAASESKFFLATIECAAVYVEVIASAVAAASPEKLTRENLVPMLMTAAKEIRALKEQPHVEPPTTGGAA